MSAAAGTQVAVPVPRPFSFLRGFRIIPRLETFPSVVTFAQTIIGKIAILALFGLGLYYATWLHYIHNPRWIVQICFLVAVTVLPRYRRIVLALGTFGWAFGIWWQWAERPQIVQAAVSVVCAALIFLLAIRFRNTWFGRRPVATLLTGFALTVFVASYLPRGGSLRTVAFDFLPVAAAYLWFLAYSLMDIPAKNRDSVASQVGAYQPVWGSTATPFPKGSAYLRRIEAKNPEQLAVAQLKGLKLLAWSLVLDLFLTYAYTPLRSRIHGHSLLRIRVSPQPGASSVPLVHRLGQSDFGVPRAHDRVLDLRTPHHRSVPHGRISRPQKHVASAGIAFHRGVLEPLLLLLQGTSGRLLLLSSLHAIFQALGTLAFIRLDGCRSRLRKCFLSLLPRPELR